MFTFCSLRPYVQFGESDIVASQSIGAYKMSLNNTLSALIIGAPLIAAILAFESSVVSWGIISLSVLAASAAALEMVRNKREMTRIKAITNANAHAMLGGL